MADRPDIEGIQKRCAAATPGPWTEAVWAGGVHHVIDPDPDDSSGSTDAWFPRVPALFGKDRSAETKRNVEFISHARTDLPALLDELKELRVRLKALAEDWKDLDPDILDVEGVGATAEHAFQFCARRLLDALGEK